MIAETKYFGTIDIGEDKLLDFPNGIIGFPDLRKFTIIYDLEKGYESGISWLQSMEEPLLALPIVDPLYIMTSYNPMIEDELLKPLDSPEGEDMLVLLALTVPSDITKMTANMKAPFIINTKTKKGGQIIVENDDYQIKFNVYEAIEQKKQKAGE